MFAELARDDVGPFVVAEPYLLSVPSLDEPPTAACFTPQPAIER